MTRTHPPKARHHHIPRCSASSKRARASRVRRTCGAHHTARDNAAAAIHATARARSLRCMARRLRRAVQRLRHAPRQEVLQVEDEALLPVVLDDERLGDEVEARSSHEGTRQEAAVALCREPLEVLGLRAGDALVKRRGQAVQPVDPHALADPAEDEGGGTDFSTAATRGTEAAALTRRLPRRVPQRACRPRPCPRPCPRPWPRSRPRR